jgi:co-chaperonin GroES (HSP10)
VSVTFQPLRNGVLLALEPTPEKSKLIQVAGSLEDLVRFATVVAVGPEVKDAKVGQRVLASVTAGVEVPGGMLIGEPAIIGLETA